MDLKPVIMTVDRSPLDNYLYSLLCRLLDTGADPSNLVICDSGSPNESYPYEDVRKAGLERVVEIRKPPSRIVANENYARCLEAGSG